MKQLAKPLLCAIPLAAILFASPEASAETFGFVRITSNSSINLLDQLYVDVMDPSLYAVNPVSGFVDFTFRNIGPISSSITEIYFDDGMLGPVAVVTSLGSPGVSFLPSVGTNLPGSSGPTPEFIDFVATAGFTADATSPIMSSGVNPGEWLTLRFGLGSLSTFDNVIAKLKSPTEDTDTDVFNPQGKKTGTIDEGASLRIGIHVQSIGGGTSDSYINQTSSKRPPGTPDGGTTIALLGVAMFGADLLRRRLVKA